MNRTSARAVAGIIAALLCLAAAPALADADGGKTKPTINAQTLDDNAPFKARSLALDATVGAGTPLGVGGISLEGSPIPMLVMSAGVGMGVEGVRGAIAFGPRFVFAEQGALDLNLGYAVGNHRNGDGLSNLGGLARGGDKLAGGDTVASAHMFTMSLHGRYRSMDGLQAGLMVGVSKIMNENDFAAPGQDVWLPYLGASFGYAFSL